MHSPTQSSRAARRLVPALLLLAGTGAFLWARQTAPPAHKGLAGEHLHPCGDRPNCACSEDPRPGHHVEPLACPDPASPAEGLDALLARLAGQPGVRIVRHDPGYAHLTVTTPLLRFTDDVELRADPVAGCLHVRSASRMGYGDLGTNRRRVEWLRTLLDTRPGPAGGGNAAH